MKSLNSVKTLSKWYDTKLDESVGMEQPDLSAISSEQNKQQRKSVLSKKRTSLFSLFSMTQKTCLAPQWRSKGFQFNDGH